ncbi:MAG TPA: hypothetical protein EYP49_12025, partial [Anaerolineae bacterium]|nr:hypothetical protein [Anaerolineae bacterium]
MTANDLTSSTNRVAALKGKLQQHSDFLLLLGVFIVFRISSVIFFRPGGYTRDYTDLIYYQRRATWQEFGMLPYQHYWSEYPPLFPWLSVWIQRWTHQIPLWEDERLWYSIVFGLFTLLTETITFICLYILGRRLYGLRAMRVAWLYAGLFLPVYLLSGWFDALAVVTIFLTLTLLVI